MISRASMSAPNSTRPSTVSMKPQPARKGQTFPSSSLLFGQQGPQADMLSVQGQSAAERDCSPAARCKGVFLASSVASTGQPDAINVRMTLSDQRQQRSVRECFHPARTMRFALVMSHAQGAYLPGSLCCPTRCTVCLIRKKEQRASTGGVTFVRVKMGRWHAMRRFTISWRPQRAAMCRGLSSMDCSVTAATLAPNSTSRQIASTFAGPCT